jgi:hypothetical protein
MSMDVSGMGIVAKQEESQNLMCSFGSIKLRQIRQETEKI